MDRVRLRLTFDDQHLINPIWFGVSRNGGYEGEERPFFTFSNVAQESDNIVEMRLSTARCFISFIYEKYKNGRRQQGVWEIVHFKDGEWVPVPGEIRVPYKV